VSDFEMAKAGGCTDAEANIYALICRVVESWEHIGQENGSGEITIANHHLQSLQAMLFSRVAGRKINEALRS
jgi:hypothetical protein